ncbi:hypothetical protein [Marinobacter sp. F3R08]|uniref:hypothetical protein n=1 Tax=Marinobacter sp. F3R08 TaxID=2841559 RepID=UPI001C08448C|nr:hypothetical protein [Marinobacter sp. F3R08]MBU2952687.1 hypothetical protein [Marinobacter sp. F3R08]
MVSRAKVLSRLAMLVAGLVALVLPLAAAQAHETDATSARATLRAGQVELTIITNADHWRAILSSSESWLLGDTDALMPQNLTDAQEQAFLQQVMTEQTQLLVNGRTLPFDRVSISRPSGSDDIEIVVLARHSFHQVEQLSVTFPASLGGVHLSVVKPLYRVLSPGEPADVLY